jgi:uncharacterized protein
MRSFYIAATESSGGKTALSVGLASALRTRGIDVGYFKPLGISAAPGEVDGDATFVAAALGLPEAPEELCPLTLTENAVVPLNGQGDPAEIMSRGYEAVAAAHDMVICEGLGEIWQGRFLRMSGADVTARLGLQVLLAARFVGTRQLDDICYVHDVIKQRMLGAVFTMVPDTRMVAVQHHYDTFLADNGIKRYGAVPLRTQLAAVPLGDIAAALNGRICVGDDLAGRFVETYMIGAMSPEHARGYFERTPNKVIVVGGDREDIILAALGTSTVGFILTGEYSPSKDVVQKAERDGVALICVGGDTATAAESLRRLFGRLRVHEPSKIQLIQELVAGCVDIDGLIGDLS